ncbi:adaptin ear-binding coat-associated protein 2-like [Dysidea avara]|uniref:adaptin ear-binding coat-associated protein 2-like n=1 Tax=Dysidea avara TaxID=196820 RepID=UPI003326E8CC
MDYESISLVKPEALVYNIPPRQSIKVVRAADWNLAEPDWVGRLKVVAKGENCFIKLEDKNTGELFAICPVRSFPGTDVEPVSDSSRYFVLKLEDTSGQHAFVGMGFSDRGDAFDFNVALQDHFKWVKQSKEIVKEQQNPAPAKDYSLKQGEKIKINIGALKGSSSGQTTKPVNTGGAGLGLLPPPPSSGVAHVQPIIPPSQPVMPASQPTTFAPSNTSNDDWGDFFSSRTDTKPSGNTGGGSSSGNTSSSSGGGGGGWVQF